MEWDGWLSGLLRLLRAPDGANNVGAIERPKTEHIEFQPGLLR